MRSIVTIGGYGFTEQMFIEKLLANRVSDFFDIRQRRGVRGSAYRFLNKNMLEKILQEAKIRVHYVPKLAPTQEIRMLQRTADTHTRTRKKDRMKLDPSFCDAYELVLQKLDVSSIFEIAPQDAVVALFCVETEPDACHRYLAANWLSDRLKIPVKHIVP